MTEFHNGHFSDQSEYWADIARTLEFKPAQTPNDIIRAAMAPQSLIDEIMADEGWITRAAIDEFKDEEGEN